MSRSSRYSSTSARATYDREVARVVARRGVFIQFVSGSMHARQPSFAYTVGLAEHGHPELLSFGACPDCAGELMNEVADLVAEGSTLRPGEILVTESAGPLLVETVPNPQVIPLTAVRYAERYSLGPIGLLPLTFPDSEGRFPSDAGYDAPGWREPRPGEFTALA